MLVCPHSGMQINQLIHEITTVMAAGGGRRGRGDDHEKAHRARPPGDMSSRAPLASATSVFAAGARSARRQRGAALGQQSHGQQVVTCPAAAAAVYWCCRPPVLLAEGMALSRLIHVSQRADVVGVWFVSGISRRSL